MQIAEIEIEKQWKFLGLKRIGREVC
jgi:hypothetical protein